MSDKSMKAYTCFFIVVPNLNTVVSSSSFCSFSKSNLLLLQFNTIASIGSSSKRRFTRITVDISSLVKMFLLENHNQEQPIMIVYERNIFIAIYMHKCTQMTISDNFYMFFCNYLLKLITQVQMSHVWSVKKQVSNKGNLT